MDSFVDLLTVEFDEKAVYLLNESFVRKNLLIPIKFHPDETGHIIVAMSDTDNFIAIDDVKLITGYEVEAVGAEKAQILAQIARYFNRQSVMDAAEQYRKEHAAEKKDENTADTDSVRGDHSAVVRAVKTIMEGAARMRASDIHFEPMRENVRVRYRVDGNLKEIMTYDRNIYSAIITRIKVLSQMDISEKRKPQDGRTSLKVDQEEYDVRVSSIPTVHGEKIVMRLNAKEYLARDKQMLGMSERDIAVFDQLLSRPHGIILVTGPTGSGKSTTLYTALHEINQEAINIVTIEDPVEAYLDGVNQIQVNTKANLTFANALRSILRQDPDVIMIGEIRDYETAEMAVRASITGHLVAATLHTNSTVSSITRLLDMGVKSYMVADALSGVIAQRLVRKLCVCKRGRKALPAELRNLGLSPEEELTIYEPVGCTRCGNSGYYERIGVFEIMDITPDIRNAISKMMPASRIRELAAHDGMRTLKQNAVQLVRDGVTSMEEIKKIIYEN